MKIKSITLLALLLLGTLTLSGCGLFHHGHRRCGTPCAMSAEQKPCQQQENCVKAECNKPCCAKMKTAEAPVQ
jgi:hypothetical protein